MVPTRVLTSSVRFCRSGGADGKPGFRGTSDRRRRGGMQQVAAVKRWWRVLRAGSAFLLFGALGLGVGYVVVPLQRLFFRSGGSDLDTQRAIHWGYRIFISYIAALRIVRVTTVGREKLRADGPLLIVANHPTIADTPAVVSMLPQADCPVDAGWAANPFLRRAVAAAGYLRNDRGPATVTQALRHLAAGRTVLIFPEGTRSPVGKLGPFNRGAAYLALVSGCDLLPIAITCEPHAFSRGRKWYDLPDREVQLTLRVGEPISLQPYLDSTERRSLLVDKLNAALREWFVKRLGYAED